MVDERDGRQHEFGGDWTEAKLAVLQGYLAAYTRVLKDKPSKERPFRTGYIDAFAGTGYRTPVESSSDEATLTFPDLASPEIRTRELAWLRSRLESTIVVAEHLDLDAVVEALDAHGRWRPIDAGLVLRSSRLGSSAISVHGGPDSGAVEVAVLFDRRRYDLVEVARAFGLQRVRRTCGNRPPLYGGSVSSQTREVRMMALVPPAGERLVLSFTVTRRERVEETGSALDEPGVSPSSRLAASSLPSP